MTTPAERDLIDRAKHHLMRTHHWSESAAFRHLRTTAMTERVPIAQIARRLLASQDELLSEPAPTAEERTVQQAVQRLKRCCGWSEIKAQLELKRAARRQSLTVAALAEQVLANESNPAQPLVQEQRPAEQAVQQAIGLVAKTCGWKERRALDELKQASMKLGIRLVVLAEQVLASPDAPLRPLGLPDGKAEAAKLSCSEDEQLDRPNGTQRNALRQRPDGKGWLLLTRQRGESIMIGDDIRITVTGVRSNRCYLRIKAPKNVPVLRMELAEVQFDPARTNDDDTQTTPRTMTDLG